MSGDQHAPVLELLRAQYEIVLAAEDFLRSTLDHDSASTFEKELREDEPLKNYLECLWVCQDSHAYRRPDVSKCGTMTKVKFQ